MTRYKYEQPSSPETNYLKSIYNWLLGTAAGVMDDIAAYLHSLDDKVVVCDTSSVTVTATALPPGAATEATLAAAEVHLTNIDADTGTIAGDTTSLDGKVDHCDTDNVTVVAMPAVAVVFPANLVREVAPHDIQTAVESIDSKIGATVLADMETHLGTIATDVNNAATEATLVGLDANVVAIGIDTASLAAEDFATEATLSALDAKVTACNTGAVTVAASALPLNAAIETGGNLDTIAGVDFALETGGNLATLAGKDFALETGGNLEAIKTAVAAMTCNTGAIAGTVAVSSMPVSVIDQDAAAATPHQATITVTTAGIAVPISVGALLVNCFTLMANPSNSGYIYVGDSTVHKNTAPFGHLGPGDSYTYECPPGVQTDLQNWYVDASVNLEDAYLLYTTVA